MRRLFFLLSSFAVWTVFWGCSSADDGLADSHQWSVSTSVASKDSTFCMDSCEVATRALFIGGASGVRYISLWDESDVVQVYRAGTTTSSVGTMKPATTDVPTTQLTGTLSGTFSVGDDLDFYIPKANIDYTGQKGNLTDMTNYAYMSSTVKIDQIGKKKKIYTKNVTFKSKQCYLRLRFVDSDGIRLPVEQLTISTSSGMILLQKPLSGTVVHGDLVINPVKENGAYPIEVYVALHNDLGASDTYTFTVRSGGYVYGGSSGSFTFKLVDGNYYLSTRTLTLLSAAVRLNTGLGSTVTQQTDGGGDNNGSVTF